MADDLDDAVFTYVDINIGRDAVDPRCVGSVFGLASGRHRQCQDESATCLPGPFQEITPANVLDIPHDCPSAARWIASRIRVYVPQRHKLPLMALSISSSLGSGLPASKATALMICPD